MVKCVPRKPKTTKIDQQLKEHAHDLDYLRKSKGTVQKAILRDSKPSLVKVLVSLAGNILSGAIHLTPKQKTDLEKYADVIRELVRGSRSTRQRKSLVVKHTNQHGGFLGFLINPIAKLIGGLINN